MGGNRSGYFAEADEGAMSSSTLLCPRTSSDMQPRVAPARLYPDLQHDVLQPETHANCAAQLIERRFGASWSEVLRPYVVTDSTLSFVGLRVPVGAPWVEQDHIRQFVAQPWYNSIVNGWDMRQKPGQPDGAAVMTLSA